MRHHRNVFESIYTTVPEVKPGVRKTLGLLRQVDIGVVVVTHANENWANFKAESTGLIKDLEAIEVIDEKNYKNKYEWLGAIERNNETPSTAMIVGDSKISDIDPAKELGVNNIVWVNESESWSLYRDGKLPDGVQTIHGMDELLNVA